MKRLLLLLALVSGLAIAQVQNFWGIAISSAARTSAQVNSSDLTGSNFSGVHVVMNVSAYTSGNCTPKVQAPITPGNATYYDLLVGTAMSATGTQVIKVYPGIVASANASASDFLPVSWRVQVNCASTPSMTYSVNYYVEH